MGSKAGRARTARVNDAPAVGRGMVQEALGGPRRGILDGSRPMVLTVRPLG